MKRLRITLATALKEAPSEVRIFRAGINKTTKGNFLFDAKAAKAVMKAFEEYGNRLCFDYAHAVVPEKNAKPQDQKAAGWFDLEVRDGELWAVNIEWTATAQTEIEAKEWMYISPWFIFDEKTGRVLEILNIALTNVPATKEAAPLIAADMTIAADSRTAFLAGFKATQRALEEALRKRYPQPPEGWLWIAEVYDDRVVFSEGSAGALWQQEYALQGLTAVLVGDRVQVEVTYSPVQVSVSRDAPPAAACLDKRAEALGSFQDVIASVRDAITKRYPQPNGWELYPDAVYDDAVVFRNNGRCWQQAYHLDGTVAVLDGDPVEVEISYVPVQQPAAAAQDNGIPQSQGAAASTERASAQQESLMDKAFLSALGLAENAPDTEALAKLTSVAAREAKLCALTGKTDPDEALGVASAWKESADKLPAAQEQVSKLTKAQERAEVVALLDKAEGDGRLTPVEKTDFLTGYDNGEVALSFLKGKVPNKPVHAALDKANKPNPPAVTNQADAASAVALTHNGKTYEQLSMMEKDALYRSDKATFDALKADSVKRTGK